MAEGKKSEFDALEWTDVFEFFMTMNSQEKRISDLKGK